MKTFSFKLYHSKKNKYLHQAVDISGIIYNYCIAAHRRYYRLFGKSLNKYQLQKHLAKLKNRPDHKYWAMVGSQAIQDITDRIQRSYILFFSNLKRKIKCSPPGFKKVKRYKSFTLKQAGYEFYGDNKVRIGNNIYKFSKSREIEGNIKTVTVKRNLLGEIFIFVVTDYSSQSGIRVRTGKMAGMDFGMRKFLTLYDGEKHAVVLSPEFYKTGIEDVQKAGRILSRKVKGSNNRKKALAAYFRTHEKIANQRKDHHFKLALELCRKYDALFFENLDMKAMQKRWGRKISDLGFSSFLRIVESQAAKHYVKVSYIDRFYPSSKECSACGYVLERLDPGTVEWDCPVCVNHHERDENASNNIYRVGTSTPGGEAVKLDIAS